MLESDFSRELLWALNDLDQYSHFNKICDRFQVGMPDIIGCFEGKYVGIEVKHVHELLMDKAQPRLHKFSPIQIVQLGKIAKAGGAALGIIACGVTGFLFNYTEIDAKTGRIENLSSGVTTGKINKFDVREKVIVKQLIRNYCEAKHG